MYREMGPLEKRAIVFKHPSRVSVRRALVTTRSVAGAVLATVCLYASSGLAQTPANSSPGTPTFRVDVI